MALCKDFSGKSLSVIGNSHGGRDHATVLHAHKEIANKVDIKDDLVYERYVSSLKKVNLWIENELEKRDEFRGRYSQERTIFNTEK
jgi:hypothetical protein